MKEFGDTQEVRATYMRGGTSKGVFFALADLPEECRQPGPARDAFLLRVVGSPDPYRKHTDGMGGATSSTSKVVLVSPSARPGCDVDYLFGAVAIDAPVIDWSGNCGNLTAAVGPFAIARGMVAAASAEGCTEVRIWQENIGKKIVAQVPTRNDHVVEDGAFVLDGVTFPSAEIRLAFLDPADDGAGSGVFPTGRATDILDVPGLGSLEVSLVNSGNPTIFAAASDFGLHGTESADAVNAKRELLGLAESVRSIGAVAMGLAATPEDATRNRPHTPKLALLSGPAEFTSSAGTRFSATDMDLHARIFSMGKLHHAMTGTGAVAIATAAAIPGTLVSRVLDGAPKNGVCFAHPSGLLRVGASVSRSEDGWSVAAVEMSRSARRLMDGVVVVPSSWRSSP